MKIVLTVVVTLAVLGLAALAVVLFGWYNVAATQPHTGVVYWSLDTLQQNSIDRHAGGVAVLGNWNTGEHIAEGSEHYREMCVMCHGAPGQSAGEFAKGLNPQPPDLAESAEDFTPQEVYWTIKHGIKMTGMPAFGVTHSDDKIWAITAFVEQLPEMTAEEFEAMGSQDPESGAHQHEEHDHQDDESSAEPQHDEHTPGHKDT